MRWAKICYNRMRTNGRPEEIGKPEAVAQQMYGLRVSQIGYQGGRSSR